MRRLALFACLAFAAIGCDRQSQRSEPIAEARATEESPAPVAPSQPAPIQSSDSTASKPPAADSSDPEPSLPDELKSESIDAETSLATSDSKDGDTETAEAAPASTPDHENELASTSSADTMMATEEPKPNRPHYLLWLPTTKGPVVLGLDVWIGEETLASAFETAFANLMEEAQRESADEWNWDSFLDHVAANPNTFGSNVMRVDGQKRNLIKNYDRNENGAVELEEAKRFVLRDSLLSSEFRMYGTDAFRYLNRSKSRLFAAIDRNDDRALDADEIAAAPQTLIAELDANSDGCIGFAEAEPENEMDSNAWSRKRSRRHGDVAMDLAGFVSWNNLSYSLNARLDASPFLADGSPIKSLDLDASESIEPDEAKRLLEFSPSIHITVRYPESGAPATVEMDELEEQDTVEISQSPSRDRLVLTTDRIQLAIALRDSARVNTQIPREAFDQLDANKDGGLDEDEIPDGAEEQLNLETLDQNEDGKLSYQELTERRVAIESIWSRQVRGRAAEYPAAIFAWLDRDHDHFLSAREVQATDELLSELLGDRESVRPDDFPESYLVQIGRGEPQQDDALFTPQRERRPGMDARPTWAIRMDANRDGEIATIEFPGAIEQFRKLDRDNDGYLSAEEVSSL